LMTVRFQEPPDLSRVRGALGSAGIDVTKVTLQPDTAKPSDVIIHAPQLEAANEVERRVDEDKRAIIKALQGLSPSGDVSAGKTNINTITPEGIEQELRQGDPLDIARQNFAGPHPYSDFGRQ